MNAPGGLRHDEMRDALTGLPGAEAARARVEQWLSEAAANGEAATVHAMLLGLRRLDTVNLAYGASAGDAALIEIAARMAHFAASELDEPWLLARASGGNFLIVANQACSRDRWQLFAEQIADTVARPIALTDGMLRLSPRIALLRGLVAESADSMLDRLGQTLAGAQQKQGSRLIWADGDTTLPGHTAAELEADLLVALDRDQIEVVYQPQFSLPEDRLTGAEALARWNHPQLGRIGAGLLFAIAERTDHLAPLSRHVARKALAGAREWPASLRLSLNVTATDLAASSYADELMRIVAESGFAADRLTLEVTEQTLLNDLPLAADSLRKLSGAGMCIALDDFGAGFCNFRYLKLLPLDFLKLDRSMVEDVITDPRDLAVLRAIVAMAGALDLRVIAEGVESEAQRLRLAQEGCAYYQGFLRAQPMGAREFARLALAAAV